MTGVSNSSGAGVFVEQAEYLNNEEFSAWTESHPDERQILQKLCRGGAKLITGPRGCGKTTLLLKAYKKLLSVGSNGLPVYVNFKSSLRLEPLYKNQANAMYWFNQWMLMKCYLGLMETCERLGMDTRSIFRFSKSDLSKASEFLELCADGSVRSLKVEVSVDELVEDIESVLQISERVRCVIFFDDAAHAFSPDQQRDFFDFFRRLKRTSIAPKAAIYPGVTILSPSFHIGHDAEEIGVWIDPYSPKYIPFMRKMLSRRLPFDVYSRMEKDEGLLNLVCYGAFGMPRALLNMVRELYDSDVELGSKGRINFTYRSVIKSIESSYENTLAVYLSLVHKLPMYKNFISSGERFLEEAVLSIKEYNKGKGVGRQSVSIAVALPIDPEIDRLFGFLQYAGLMMVGGRVSRGEKGRFENYRIHVGGLLRRNAILSRKNAKADEVSEALGSRNAHEFTRITPSKLLGVSNPSDALALALPPCQSCGTPRPNESAKFCMNCGAPLAAMSVFKSLVQCDIDNLPLSTVRIGKIKENSSLKTVGDVLMDHEHRQLRGVPRIGPYWADRIYRYAEEFIA